jgi:hypothetical protein
MTCLYKVLVGVDSSRTDPECYSLRRSRAKAELRDEVFGSTRFTSVLLRSVRKEASINTNSIKLLGNRLKVSNSCHVRPACAVTLGVPLLQPMHHACAARSFLPWNPTMAAQEENDNEVRRVDQDQINRFARLNVRKHEIETDIVQYKVRDCCHVTQVGSHYRSYTHTLISFRCYCYRKN